jgi:hypothetical protein
MNIDNYLKKCSNPNVHPEINRLNNEHKIRIKNFMDEIIERTGREFKISELKLLNDRIDIAVTYGLSMF